MKSLLTSDNIINCWGCEGVEGAGDKIVLISLRELDRSRGEKGKRNRRRRRWNGQKTGVRKLGIGGTDRRIQREGVGGCNFRAVLFLLVQICDTVCHSSKGNTWARE